MKILRAYRSELDPTTEQRKAMSRAAGAARWTYNWGLTRWREQYVVWQAWSKSAKTEPEPVRPSWMALHKELTQIKRLPETEWLAETSAYVVREAMADLGLAYKNFFRRLKEGLRGKAAGEPQYRSRNDPSGRGFRIAQPQAVNATSRTVRIAGVGDVKLKRHDYIPTGANYRGVSVRETAGRWFAAVQVEEADVATPVVSTERVGIELGVRVLTVTSDGKKFGAIRDLKNIASIERRLKLWQRRMSRRHVSGTKSFEQPEGWREALRHTQRLHYQISCMRKDALHQATTRIVRKPAGTYVLRDMRVQGMIGRAGKSGAEARTRNRLAPMVAKVGMFEFRRQVEYKAGWAGAVVEIAPNDYPSTRRCSACGNVRATDPGYPYFTCGFCRVRMDREQNSAQNLKDFVPQNTAGGNGGGTLRRKTTKVAQRPNEPEHLAAGVSMILSTSPDGAEISTQGVGNRAARGTICAETDATEDRRDPTERPVSGRAISINRSISNAEVMHRSSGNGSAGLRAASDGGLRGARKRHGKPTRLQQNLRAPPESIE